MLTVASTEDASAHELGEERLDYSLQGGQLAVPTTTEQQPVKEGEEEEKEVEGEKEGKEEKKEEEEEEEV